MEKLQKILGRFSLLWRTDGLMKEKDDHEEWISNFIPVVIKCMYDISNGQILFDLEVYFGNSKEPIRRDGIPVDKIQKMDWFKDIDCRCCVAPYKATIMKTFLYYQISLMDTVPIINRMGWHLYENKMIYCFGSKVIGATEVNVSEKLKCTFPENVELAFDQKEISRDILEMLCCCGENGYSLFLSGLYSFLGKVFEDAGIEKKYALYLYGKSATYKTTLARYFSCWGPGWDREAIFSLESTNRAREEELTKFSDCMCVLDDLAPLENRSASRQRNDQVGSVIRSTVNNAERKRMVGGKTVSTMVNVLLVVTAERILEIESIMNRCWLLNAEKFLATKEFLEFMKKHPNLIGTFFSFFIDWVINNYEKIICLIQSGWKYYEKANKKSGVVNARIYETFKTILIVHGIFGEYMKEIFPEVWTQEVDQSMQSRINKIFIDNLKTSEMLHEAGRNQSLEERVINALCQMLDSKEIMIYKEYMSCMHEDYRDGKYTYIRSRNLLDLLNKKMGLEELTMNKLSRVLKSRGLISSTDKDLQVNRHGKAYYKLKRSALKEEMEYM